MTSRARLIFLDFDGVLHPDCVYRNHMTGEPEMQSPVPEEKLFMYSGYLVDVLKPFPEIEIILSTSWVPAYGFERTKSSLPEELSCRVIGSTFCHSTLSRDDFHKTLRSDQVFNEARRRNLSTHDWVVIDDDSRRWREHESNLIECGHHGLSDGRVRERLIVRLSTNLTRQA